MTFRQQAKHSLKAGDWFRAVAGGVLAVVVAACVVVPPVSVTGDAPALTAVQSNFALGVGQEQSLLPFIRIAGTGEVPFVPLKWEVSDPSLLSIDPATGRAKGLAAGTAVVKVTVQGRESGSAQLFVEVAGEGVAAVREIRVRPASHNLVVGEEVVLRAEVVLPDGQINGNVVWSSSDDTIAIVNPTNGEVRALKPGRVTIVAAYSPAPIFKGLAEILVRATQLESTPAPTAPETPTASQSPSMVTATSPPSLALPTVLVSTLAGSTEGYADGTGVEATLNWPCGVAVDSAGNVYVADRSNNLIRRVSSEGVVTTLAGSTKGYADGTGIEAAFRGLRGLALDASGIIYVADTDNHRIRAVRPGNVVTTLTGSTEGYRDGVDKPMFGGPHGLAVDSAGSIYVADSYNHRIRKINPEGLVTTVAGSTQGYSDGTGTDAKFRGPRDLALDSAGNIYVADTYNHRIRKINPEGLVTTVAGSTEGYSDGTGVEAKFRSPQSLAVDRDGNIYVADTDNHRIRMVSPAGVVRTLAGSTEGYLDGTGVESKFRGPRGIAVNAVGSIYVADTDNHRIRKITFSP
jgi:sugar lactone lactonase YvrE